MHVSLLAHAVYRMHISANISLPDAEAAGNLEISIAERLYHTLTS